MSERVSEGDGPNPNPNSRFLSLYISVRVWYTACRWGFNGESGGKDGSLSTPPSIFVSLVKYGIRSLQYVIPGNVKEGSSRVARVKMGEPAWP